MKTLNKIVGVVAAAAILASPAAASAAVDVDHDMQATSYQDSSGCSYLAPGIALGVIAAIAVVAIIVTQHEKGTVHNHYHCSGE